LNALERSDELYDIYIDKVTTNLAWDDIIQLLPLAAYFSDTTRIQHYFIGPAEVINWVTPGGWQVLLPRKEAIATLLLQALGNP